MSWFQVDDLFHSNPKVIAAGNAAAGLYARCGSYVSQHLTDGFVSEAVAHSYGSRKEIETLVTTTLWTVTPGGYLMRDYLQYNPPASKVKERRKAATERQRRARDAAARKRVSHAVTGGVTDTVTHAEVTVPPVVPTELLTPAPTPSTQMRAVRPSATDRGNRLLDGFELHFGPTPRKALAAIGSAIDELVTENAVSDIEIVGGLRAMTDAGVGPGLLAEMVRRAKNTGLRRYVPEPANRDRPWTA